MAEPILSDIELIVYNWLTKRKIVFEYGVSISGGVFELGGAKVDFLLPERNLVWRVMGEYWHREISTRGQDVIQRELLEGRGWTVVDIWSSDLEDPNRVNETLTRALRGEEML